MRETFTLVVRTKNHHSSFIFGPHISFVQFFYHIIWQFEYKNNVQVYIDKEIHSQPLKALKNTAVE